MSGSHRLQLSTFSLSSVGKNGRRIPKDDLTKVKAGSAAQMRSASAMSLLVALHVQYPEDPAFADAIKLYWWVSLLAKGGVYEIGPALQGEPLICLGSNKYCACLWRLAEHVVGGETYYAVFNDVAATSNVKRVHGHEIVDGKVRGVFVEVCIPALAPLSLQGRGILLKRTQPEACPDLIKFALLSHTHLTVDIIKKMMVSVGVKLSRLQRECRASLFASVDSKGLAWYLRERNFRPFDCVACNNN